MIIFEFVTIQNQQHVIINHLDLKLATFPHMSSLTDPFLHFHTYDVEQPLNITL